MKTIFEHTEIINFLSKNKDEVVADEIIYKTTMKPEFSEILSFNDMLHHIYKMGLAQGNLEGRMDMIDKMLTFFEIQ
jgi:hypothetical protein